ncbi:MAG: carbohydrate porin [Alphaproteobacteria bacterium]|nr:carbohydrate porin [Alphaproteobacteria bacterium]
MKSRVSHGRAMLAGLGAASPRAALGLALLSGSAGLAAAQTTPPAEAPAPPAPNAPTPAPEAPATPEAQPPDQGGAPSHQGGLWERDLLTGDWDGWRSRLEQQGVQLGVNYIGEVLGNPTGGIRQGAIYEDRFEMYTTIDLEKAVGWSGATFHANAYHIDGRGLTANNLDNLLIASNIEATRSSRLFDLWLQQDLFEGKLQVRAGQIAADDEFFISQYATIFVNSTFGWPGILATDLPSGGPAYPLATPGVRFKITPSEEFSVLAAVFNGDPAGAGTGDPQQRDASGTSFRFSDGAFAIVEGDYGINQAKDATGLPGTYKLGGWYHGGRFADQRFDNTGLSLANPASTGVPALHNGNYGIYAVADQLVWRQGDSGDQGLGVFARLSGSPADRNLISFYADAGVTYKGLIPGRDSDVLGLGIAYAKISSDAADRDRDAQSFGNPGHPVRDFETAIELTYQVQLAPWWTVQPDLQYIIHPGGNIVNPNTPSSNRPIPDAFVAGLRMTVSF